MNRWIDNEGVSEAQESGDVSALEEAGISFCMSPDRTYCVLVRDHEAWYVDGEGWRDGNYSPEGNETGRPMLNFFKRQVSGTQGLWFKVFVPAAVTIGSIRAVDQDSCEVIVDSRPRRLSFDRIGGLIWDVMTGNAEPEEEIEATFAKVWDS